MAIKTDVEKIALQNPGTRPVSQPVQIRERASSLARDLGQFNEVLNKGLQVATDVAQRNDMIEKRRVETDKRVRAEMMDELALRGKVAEMERKRAENERKRRKELLDAQNSEQFNKARQQALMTSLSAGGQQEIGSRISGALENDNRAAASAYAATALEVYGNEASIMVKKEIERLKVENPDALVDFDQREFTVNAMNQMLANAGLDLDSTVALGSEFDEEGVTKSLESLQSDFNNLEDDITGFSAQTKKDRNVEAIMLEANTRVGYIVSNESEDIGQNLYEFNEGFSKLPQNERAKAVLSGFQQIVEMKSGDLTDMTPDEFLGHIRKAAANQKNGAPSYLRNHLPKLYDYYDKFVTAHEQQIASTGANKIGFNEKALIDQRVRRVTNNTQQDVKTRRDGLSEIYSDIISNGTDLEKQYAQEKILPDIYDLNTDVESLNEGLGQVKFLIGDESGGDAFQVNEGLRNIMANNRLVDKKQVSDAILRGVTLDVRDPEAFARGMASVQARTKDFQMDSDIFNTASVLNREFSKAPENVEEFDAMLESFNQLRSFEPNLAKSVLANNPRLKRAVLDADVGRTTLGFTTEESFERAYQTPIEDIQMAEDVEATIAQNSYNLAQTMLKDETEMPIVDELFFQNIGRESVGVRADTASNLRILESKIADIYRVYGSSISKEEAKDIALTDIEQNSMYVTRQTEDGMEVHFLPNNASSGISISGSTMRDMTDPANTKKMAKYTVMQDAEIPQGQKEMFASAVDNSEDVYFLPNRAGTALTVYSEGRKLKLQGSDVEIPLDSMYNTYRLSLKEFGAARDMSLLEKSDKPALGTARSFQDFINLVSDEGTNIGNLVN